MINVKVGDIVYRYFGVSPSSGRMVEMELVVTEVTDKKIVCGDYEFNRETGGEIDDYFGFDGTGLTCSVIVKNKSDISNQ